MKYRIHLNITPPADGETTAVRHILGSMYGPEARKSFVTSYEKQVGVIDLPEGTDPSAASEEILAKVQNLSPYISGIRFEPVV